MLLEGTAKSFRDNLRHFKTIWLEKLTIHFEKNKNKILPHTILRSKFKHENVVIQVLKVHTEYFYNLGIRKAFLSNLKLTGKGQHI